MADVSIALPHINLLHGRSEQLKRERTLYAKVQFIAMVVLIMYIGLLVALVAIRSYFSAEQNKITQAISTESLAIAQMKPVEEKFILLQNKLTLLTDYLRSRGQARKYLLDIYQTLPAGVLLQKVSVGAQEDSLTIGASAQTMQALIAYFNLIESSVNQGAYKQIALTGLGRGQDGSYGILAEYSIPE